MATCGPGRQGGAGRCHGAAVDHHCATSGQRRRLQAGPGWDKQLIRDSARKRLHIRRPSHLVSDSQVQVAAASQQRQLAGPGDAKPDHADVGVCRVPVVG